MSKGFLLFDKESLINKHNIQTADPTSQIKGQFNKNHKKLKTMKILIRKFLSIIIKTINILFIYTPALIIYLAAFNYTIGMSYSNEQYYILFLTIGLTATLSGLSFRASSGTQDKEKKAIFLYCGERLFHATLLFSTAIVLKYAISPGVFIVRIINNPIIKPFAVILETIYFFFGIIYITNALSSLHKILFEKRDEPLSGLRQEEIDKLIKELQNELPTNNSIPLKENESE